MIQAWRGLDIPGIQGVCNNAGLLCMPKPPGDNLLVYKPRKSEVVDQHMENLSDEELLGNLLGYKCPGDIGTKNCSVDFIVKNRESKGRVIEESFLGYLCKRVGSSLLEELIDEGEGFKKFFSDNDIAYDVKLRVMGPGVSYDMWL